MRLKFRIPVAFASIAFASSAQAATCTVPNTLSNGSIADATQVMGNFNAVAACVNGAVATTGTVTTGSIPVFSGPTSITSGNLGGDVTTAGGTTVTLAPSGVTAGTYTNATVTVDAKGRVTSAVSGTGGGSGSGATLTAANFSYLYSGTTLTQAGVGILMTSVGQTGFGNNGSPPTGYAMEAKPTGASWQFQAKIAVLNSASNFQGAGLALMDSATGNLITFGIGANTYVQSPLIMAVAISHVTGGTNSATNVFVENTDGLSKELRIRTDGVNYFFDISSSGIAWRTVYQEPIASFLASGGNMVGFSQQIWYESGSARNAIAEITAN